MAWEVILVEEVHRWYFDLEDEDPDSAALVRAAISHLWEVGPSLGRPYVDTISGSRLSNLKELRPGSSGRSEVRILFVFDPMRQAILLVAGDKSGRWQEWYREAIPIAEQRYERWLMGDYSGELK